jgi:hypothetical protein
MVVPADYQRARVHVVDQSGVWFDPLRLPLRAANVLEDTYALERLAGCAPLAYGVVLPDLYFCLDHFASMATSFYHL